MTGRIRIPSFPATARLVDRRIRVPINRSAENKGRTGKPAGFGYKAQVLDNDDGIVVDYSVECGAVPDGPHLVPAIMQVARRTGHVPPAVTADRGYGQAAVERDLHAAGVRIVVIPRQATTSAARKALGYSPTTWSRSQPSPADPVPQVPIPLKEPAHSQAATFSGRSNLAAPDRKDCSP